MEALWQANTTTIVTFFICLLVFVLFLRNRKNNRQIDVDLIDLWKYNMSPMAIWFESLPYPIKWIITRTNFLPSLAISLLKYWLPFGKYDWWNRVDDHLLLGALPLPYFIPTLVEKESVRAVVNTCDEYRGPLHLYNKFNLKLMEIPAIDFTAPRIEEINKAVEFIAEHDKKGETVYLHCKGGKGRSTTVAVCYFMKKYNITAQEALKRMMKRRPQVSRYIWQRKEVLEFARIHKINTENPFDQN